MSSSNWKTLRDLPTPESAPQLYGTALKNSHRNRYPNILAYERTRVPLYDGGYINANYVFTGANRRFIVSQAPLKTDIQAFWCMVFDTDVSLIVMLTDLFERGRSKASIYWPLPGSVLSIPRSIGRRGRQQGGTKRPQVRTGLTVTCISERSIDRTDHTDRNEATEHSEIDRPHRPQEGVSEVRETCFLLESMGKTKIVTHVWYTGWPDFGVPEDITSVSCVMDKLFDMNKDKRALVHCSAGCGRSGVICALYRCISLKESPEEAIEAIRFQRQGMVQSKSQYLFICDVLDRLRERRGRSVKIQLHSSDPCKLFLWHKIKLDKPRQRVKLTAST